MRWSPSPGRSGVQGLLDPLLEGGGVVQEAALETLDEPLDGFGLGLRVELPEDVGDPGLHGRLEQVLPLLPVRPRGGSLGLPDLLGAPRGGLG